MKKIKKRTDRQVNVEKFSRFYIGKQNKQKDLDRKNQREFKKVRNK